MGRVSENVIFLSQFGEITVSEPQHLSLDSETIILTFCSVIPEWQFAGGTSCFTRRSHSKGRTNTTSGNAMNITITAMRHPQCVCEMMSVLKTARAPVGSCGCSWHHGSSAARQRQKHFKKSASSSYTMLELLLIKFKLQFKLHMLQIKLQKELRRQDYLCPAYSNRASLDNVLQQPKACSDMPLWDTTAGWES